MPSLVGSEMCIRDRQCRTSRLRQRQQLLLCPVRGKFNPDPATAYRSFLEPVCACSSLSLYPIFVPVDRQPSGRQQCCKLGPCCTALTTPAHRRTAPHPRRNVPPQSLEYRQTTKVLRSQRARDFDIYTASHFDITLTHTGGTLWFILIHPECNQSRSQHAVGPSNRREII